MHVCLSVRCCLSPISATQRTRRRNELIYRKGEVRGCREEEEEEEEEGGWIGCQEGEGGEVKDWRGRDGWMDGQSEFLLTFVIALGGRGGRMVV